MTPNKRGYHTQVVASALYVAVIEAVCWLIPISGLQAAAGILIVCTVPGILVQFAFIQDHTSLSERALWVVVGSLSLNLLGGLVLNEVARLSKGYWLAYSAIASLLACAVVLTIGRPRQVWRVKDNEKSASPGEDGYWGAEIRRQQVRRGGNGRALIVSLLSCCLVVVALVVSQLSSSGTEERFADLSVLPASATGRPVPTAGAERATIELGNFEGLRRQFIVELFDSGHSVKIWRITVGAGDAWTVTVPWKGAGSLRVTARLERDSTKIIDYVTLKR